MATTTNYGWTTPDDTALVKDGASAIRTLGSSVDTTTKNLNPETTLGDLSFRSSTSNVNTRIPIGSSGQHLTVVAGVPAWATASDQTPLTTKGDLLGFSTLDARIPIGTNGHILTADSTESLGLKWAAPAGGGGMTLLDTMTLSGGSTTSASFASAYKQLIIYVKGAYIASGNEYHGIRLNADTGSNYSWSADAIYNTTSVIQSTFNGTTFRLNSLSTTNADDNAQRGVITITRPSDTDYVFINSDSWMRLTSSSQNQYWSVAGAYNNAAAITSITFLTEGSTYSGGTVFIYGVN